MHLIHIMTLTPCPSDYFASKGSFMPKICTENGPCLAIFYFQQIFCIIIEWNQRPRHKCFRKMFILNILFSIKNQQTRSLKLHYLRLEDQNQMYFFSQKLMAIFKSIFMKKFVFLPLSWLRNKYNKDLVLKLSLSTQWSLV